MSRCFAPCAKFHAEVGKTHAKGFSGEIRAVSGGNETGGKVGRFSALQWVERKASEKDGVAHAPRPASQRTATPTAKGFVALLSQQTDRGCKTARNPAVGVVTARNRRYYRKKARGYNRRCTKLERKYEMFENKKKFALWMYPDTLEKIGEIYREDNCESKSEFIEKAVNFYIGYLTSEDKKSYLPSVVTSTLKSIVAESDNRQNRMLFKLAVEIAIMQNLVASSQDIDRLALERLRGECVKEVKRLNGNFSFEDAVYWQKG